MPPSQKALKGTTPLPKASKVPPAISLVETRRGCAICETTNRFDVLFHGERFDQLWWNMRGYVGTLPCPDGRKLTIGERSITAYRREVAQLNREFAAKQSSTLSSPTL